MHPNELNGYGGFGNEVGPKFTLHKKPTVTTKQDAKQEFTGTLEVDLKRGVVYFHADEGQAGVPTLLRICNLGPLKPLGDDIFDITFGHGHSHKLKSHNQIGHTPI